MTPYGLWVFSPTFRKFDVWHIMRFMRYLKNNCRGGGGAIFLHAQCSLETRVNNIFFSSKHNGLRETHAMSMSPSELNFRWLDCKSSKIINMVIWVVEFSREGYKIRNIFAQKLTYIKEIIEF